MPNGTGTNVRSTARNCAYMVGPSRTVRHSPVGGITAKLSGLDPQRYLTDVLARIAGHPARQIAELLPWHWQPADLSRNAA